MTTTLLPRILGALLHRPLADEDCIAALQALRYERLARLLHYRLATQTVSPQRRERCVWLLEQLSEDAAAELLRSPALCRALRLGDPEADTLADQLEAAYAADSGVRRDVWSVLGDVWLGETAPDGTIGLNRLGRRWVGPRLACGLSLDLSLPAAVVHPSAGLREPAFPTQHRLDADCEAIDRALDLLQQTAPLGFALYRDLVSNLVLREEASRPNECWGATSGVVIGRVVMVNTHAASPTMLAEALLHEAVHCALDCAELANPLLSWQRTTDPAANATRPSPWTGNPLTPHAFIHACVVWAVLHRYWEAFHRDFPAVGGSRERESFIEKGFRSPAFAASADHASAYLSDEAPAIMALSRDALGKMAIAY